MGPGTGGSVNPMGPGSQRVKWVMLNWVIRYMGKHYAFLVRFHCDNKNIFLGTGFHKPIT